MMNSTVARLPLGAHRQCEFCDDGVVTASMETQPFQYGEGKDAHVLEAYVPVWTCSSCGEKFTDGDAERIRHDVTCVYLGRLTPDQLRASRKAAGYTQEEWAALSRHGVASIKRWESGNQIQSASADLLLRLLDNPDVRAIVARDLSRCGTPEEPTFQVLVVERYARQAASFELRPRALN